MDAAAVSAECPAGSILFFDSYLVHAAGRNHSGKDRLAINHQFTRAFFKQQSDYVRALGEEQVAGLSPRLQQLLGYFSRVPVSLDEFYRPADERVYRQGQG
jgi:ectoine hydroxylase-related dioxygenase (phytanoyl-CoA dioxygenase family)